MGNLKLNVTVDPGTTIEKAFIEGCDLARRIKIDVRFDFNGVVCICRPDGIPTTGVIRYQSEANPDVKYKMAIANNDVLESEVSNG